MVDHPRSRGVYDTNSAQRLIKRGSSPLARGLLRGQEGVRGPPRIIPARAGFTITSFRICSSQSDHPRSRGVYDGLAHDGAPGPGSSPLARGLQIETMGHSHQFGIIPARAGFTRCARPAPRRGPDHPRSRGVYSHPPVNPLSYVGSSPLARGLLSVDRVITTGTGIIPARAGFTAGGAR